MEIFYKGKIVFVTLIVNKEFAVKNSMDVYTKLIEIKKFLTQLR